MPLPLTQENPPDVIVATAGGAIVGIFVPKNSNARVLTIDWDEYDEATGTWRDDHPAPNKPDAWSDALDPNFLATVEEALVREKIERRKTESYRRLYGGAAKDQI